MEENVEDANKINVVQTQINGICNRLRIDEFESNVAKTPSQKSFFEKITQVEENNVKDIYSKPMKNFDLNKIHEYNEKFSYRPLVNELLNHRDFDINIDNIKEDYLE